MRFPHLLIAAASLAAGLAAAPARAQESKLGADVRLEGDRIAESCDGFDFKKLIGCGTTFLTDHPFHVAVGSLAPQNGMGFGAAFVPPQIKPSDNWRISWSADAVGSTSSAWRAGAYATFDTRRRRPSALARSSTTSERSTAMTCAAQREASSVR